MTSDQITLLFLVLWLVHAAVLGVVMDRRGFNGFGWAVVAGAIGPLATLLALVRTVPVAAAVQTRVGAPGAGIVDLLVGIDGSATSIDAAREAIELLDRRLGRLCLAAVEPLDGTPEHDAEGKGRLDVAVAALAPALRTVGVAPQTVVLHGRPATALAGHAREHGYDVIAVGRRGHGLSRAVLGSVATALVSRSAIPVIVGGSEEPAPAPLATDAAVTLRY
jgi:nucleotide-binding universal stress UspA family protein